jgi:hypothetical protein
MLSSLNRNIDEEEHTESENFINTNTKKSKSNNNFLSIETISGDHQLPNSNYFNINENNIINNNNNNNTNGTNKVINNIARRPSIFDYINEKGLHGVDESSNLLNKSFFSTRDEPYTRIKGSMSHGNFHSHFSPSTNIPFLQVSLANDDHENSCMACMIFFRYFFFSILFNFLRVL